MKHEQNNKMNTNEKQYKMIDLYYYRLPGGAYQMMAKFRKNKSTAFDWVPEHDAMRIINERGFKIIRRVY